MNPQTIAQFMIDEPLLGRLLFASVEMLVLAVAVWLGIRTFKPKSARLVSFLWLLVLAKPLVALAFGPIVPIVNLTVPAEPAAIETAQAPVEPVTTFVEVVTYQEPVTAMTPSTIAVTPPPTSLDVPKLLFALWLAGIAFVVLWAAIDRIRLARVVHRAEPPDESTLQLYAEVARENVRRAPPLRVTNAFESPAIAGVLRPVIFLPRWLCANGNTAQLRWALHHELIHYRHGDALANAIRQITRCVFFFHPVVWWAGKRWEEAAERACDRALVNDARDVEDYATNLYELMVQMHQRRRPLMSGLFATRTQVGRRIAALLNEALQSPKRLGAVTIAGLLVISAVVLTVGATANVASETVANGSGKQEEASLQLAAQQEQEPTLEVGPGKPVDTEPPPEITADAAYQPRPEAEWRPAFDAVYSLDEDETLRYIPIPFIPERLNYFRHVEPELSDQMPNGPDRWMFDWDEDDGLIPKSMTEGSESATLSDILEHAVGLNLDRFQGSGDVFGLQLAGDWIKRKNASMEEKLSALHDVLFRYSGRDIAFTKKVEERDVIIARGAFAFRRHPTSESGDRVVLFAGDSAAGAGGGRVHANGVLLTKLFAWVGSRIGVPIIDETTSTGNVVIGWANHPSTELNHIPEAEQNQTIRSLLKNLAYQTGLIFTRERREVERWIITEAGQTAGAGRTNDAGVMSSSRAVSTLDDSTSPAPTIRLAQQSDASEQVNVQAGAEIDNETETTPASLGKYHAYQLAPGEVLKRIAPPYPSERTDHYASPHRRRLGERQSEISAITFSWSDDDGLKKLATFAGAPGGGMSLAHILKYAIGIRSTHIVGPPEVLAHTIPGDWIVRTESSTGDRLGALSEIVDELLGRNITFLGQYFDHEVIVARGDFAYRQHPTASRTKSIVLFSGDSAKNYGGGGGQGDLDEFFAWVGDRMGVQFVNEANAAPDLSIHWLNHPSTDRYRIPSDEYRQRLDELLGNLRYQTGLTFVRERRNVEKWVIRDHEQPSDVSRGLGGVMRVKSGRGREDLQAELEKSVVPPSGILYSANGTVPRPTEWGEIRLYNLRNPYLANAYDGKQQSSPVAEIIQEVVNSREVTEATRQNTYAVYRPLDNNIVMQSEADVLDAFEWKLAEIDILPREFSMEAKVLHVPGFTPRDLGATVSEAEFKRILGDAECLGIVADRESVFDRLNARADSELLSAPRITAPEAKWKGMSKIVASQSIADRLDPDETLEFADVIRREFPMPELPNSLIFDLRAFFPKHFVEHSTPNDASEVATLLTPVCRGFAFANEVTAQDDGQLDIAFYFRDARMKPNAPDIYPNEAAAKDALDVRVFGYRYTCGDGETAVFRLAGGAEGDDLLIFVTVSEVAAR